MWHSHGPRSLSHRQAKFSLMPWDLEHFSYFRNSSNQVIFSHVSDCLEVTSGVFSRHERAIRQAVDLVLLKLVCRFGKVGKTSIKQGLFSYSS